MLSDPLSCLPASTSSATVSVSHAPGHDLNDVEDGVGNVNAAKHASYQEVCDPRLGTNCTISTNGSTATQNTEPHSQSYLVGAVFRQPVAFFLEEHRDS